MTDATNTAPPAAAPAGTARLPRIFMVVAAIAGATGVALGAFAAHGLKDRVSAHDLAIFETGARYHLIHAVALWALAAAWAGGLLTRPAAARAAAVAFVVGIVIFSGSLYTLVLSGVRTWGAVTPFGGVALIVGWLAAARAAWPPKARPGAPTSAPEKTP